MYNQKFVVAIKSNGKVLREDKDTAYLPFGCEYSVFLKNLNSLRAVVSVSIDGVDVLNGRQLVINGNSELNLERFLSDNMNEGRRFRFIERTGDIEQHRGVGVEDGIIRVEFQYEKYVKPYEYVPPYKPWEDEPWKDHYKWTTTKEYYGPLWNTCSTGDTIGPVGVSYSANSSAIPMNASKDVIRGKNLPTMDSFVNDAGITVEGSKSNQSFTTTYLGALEHEKHVIVLQLKGVSDEVKIEKPVTVKTNKHCPSCGREWPYRHEYCPKDGTFLKIN